MKKTFSGLKVFRLGALRILFCSITCFLSITSCEAQSVVGKWKRTFTKIFVMDKGTGKQVPVSAEMQKTFDEHASKYHETLELRSDNTFISTISTADDMKPRVHNGTYTLSGKDLNMNIPLVNNEKTTITIRSLSGDTMIWDLLFMGKLTEIIYMKTK